MTRILTIGIAVLDDIYAIPVPLAPGQKHRASALRVVAGGTAASAALAIARLGGRSSLLTRLGDDAGGAILRDLLAAGGIDLGYSLPVAGCSTSRSTIVIEPNGDRTIINILDPQMPDAPHWLLQALPEDIDVVLADVRWEYAATRSFGMAQERGIPRVFDGDRAPVDPDMLKLSSHAIFSAQGLREMTGHHDLGDALLALAAGHRGFLCVTDSERGLYWLDGGDVRHMPAFEIRAVDTLGAGDVFHGAFALAIGEGQPVERALRFSSAAAAIKCMRPGGGSGAPTRDELERFLTRGHL